jgi:hypothetical protein
MLRGMGRTATKRLSHCDERRTAANSIEINRDHSPLATRAVAAVGTDDRRHRFEDPHPRRHQAEHHAARRLADTQWRREPEAAKRSEHGSRYASRI